MFVRKLVQYFESFTSHGSTEERSVNLEERKKCITTPSNEKKEPTLQSKETLQAIKKNEKDNSKANLMRPLVIPSLQMLFQLSGYLPFNQTQRLAEKIFGSAFSVRNDKKDKFHIEQPIVDSISVEQNSLQQMKLLKAVVDQIDGTTLPVISYNLQQYEQEGEKQKLKVVKLEPSDAQEIRENLPTPKTEREFMSSIKSPGERFREVIKSENGFNKKLQTNAIIKSPSGSPATKKRKMPINLSQVSQNPGFGDMPVSVPISKQQTDNLTKITNLTDSTFSEDRNRKSFTTILAEVAQTDTGNIFQKNDKKPSFSKYINCFGFRNYLKARAAAQNFKLKNQHSPGMVNDLIDFTTPIDLLKSGENEANFCEMSQKACKGDKKSLENYQIGANTIEKSKIPWKKYFSDLRQPSYDQTSIKKIPTISVEKFQWKKSDSQLSEVRRYSSSPTLQSNSSKIKKLPSFHSKSSSYNLQRPYKGISSLDALVDGTFKKLSDGGEKQKIEPKIKQTSQHLKCSITDAVVPEVHKPFASISRCSELKSFSNSINGKSTLSSEQMKPKMVDCGTSVMISMVDKSTETLIETLDDQSRTVTDDLSFQAKPKSVFASRQSKQKLTPTCSKEETMSYSSHEVSLGHVGASKPLGKRLMNFFSEQRHFGKNKYRTWHKKESDEFRRYVLSRYLKPSQEPPEVTVKSKKETLP